MAEVSRLIPTLIELGIGSHKALEEVQARQVIFGGDQQTNLLEVGLVDEEQLLRALSRIEALPPTPPGPLLLDLELTVRLRTAGVKGIAGARDDGLVIVAVTQRPQESEQELSELLNEPCQLMVASTVRVQEALIVFNGEEVPRRLEALLDSLGSRLSLSQVAPPDEFGSLSRLPAVEAIFDKQIAASTQPPEEAVSSHEPVTTKPRHTLAQGEVHAETAPPPLGYEDITAFSGDPSASLARGLGPRNVYAIEEAVADLDAATDRDRVVEILVHYASSIFSYAAAFAVVGSELRGLRASGRGAPTDTVSRLVIPLDIPSAMQTSYAGNSPRIAQLRASGLEGGVARDLRRPVGQQVFLCPIAIKDRVILMLLCDCGGEPVPPEHSKRFVPIARHVSAALRRVLVHKKRQTRAPRPMDSRSLTEAPVGPSLGSPVSSGRGAHEAITVLTLTEPSAARSSIPADDAHASAPPRPMAPATIDTTASPRTSNAAHSSNPPASMPAESSPTKIGITQIAPRPLFNGEASPIATRRNPAAPPPGPSIPAENHEITSAKKRVLTRPGGVTKDADHGSDPPPSFPAEPPRTLKGYPQSHSQSPRPPTVDTRGVVRAVPPQRVPLLSRRIVAVNPSGRPPIAPEAATGSAATGAAHREEPERAPHVRPKLSEPGLFEDLQDPVEPMVTGETMVSRRVILPDQTSASDEFELEGPPQLMPVRNVRVGEARPPQSFSDLVAELLSGNDAVVPQLLDGGETAVGALIAEFPGPVSEPESPSQKASECGPILNALVRLGSKSIPFVTVRTADENPRVRRWATHVLGELPGKESARAIANRLLDGSIEVRRAALISARRVRRDPLTRRTLRAHIEQMCRDQAMDPESRCSAIEALSDMREHEAIPVLLQLMEDFHSSVARSARWAMSVLTRQDFGNDVEAWRRFWQQHRDEDRVEWLISSLDHEDRDIRRAALEELRALCGKDFGYSEDQVESERRRAQADFRTWWLETGKANLH